MAQFSNASRTGLHITTEEERIYIQNLITSLGHLFINEKQWQSNKAWYRYSYPCLPLAKQKRVIVKSKEEDE
ncbi:MAG: hypothetical protein DLM72_16605 [Candidatus Nitrosopolaris wilkensis]|nr:MAG: hypothetical protein DLM72_16605 [Candidatus Nitrosopolaris wilkensis]